MSGSASKNLLWDTKLVFTRLESHPYPSITFPEAVALLAGPPPKKGHGKRKDPCFEIATSEYRGKCNVILELLHRAYNCDELKVLNRPYSLSRSVSENDLPNEVRIGDFELWLLSMDTQADFIAPYLNSDHKYYSDELAAAHRAWIAIYGNEKLVPNKSHLEQIQQWLKENYPHLTDSAVKRIAIVVNCNKRGGAPRSN